MHGFGVRNQFVEHLRPTRQLGIVLALLIEQADGLAIAALRVGKLLLLPVQVTEFQQQNALFDARTGSFFVAFLIGTDSMNCIALSQVDVSKCIIDLVQIVLVLVRGSHTLQTADHLSALRSSHHFRHGDTRVEFYLVGWILCDDLLIGFVGLLLMPEFRLELSEQIVFASLLPLAHLVFDDLSQVGHSLSIIARVNVVVGHGIVPLLLCPPVDAVAAHVANHVLGIVDPSLFDVALCQPGTCTAVDGGLRLVEAAHVVEGGGSLVEGTLVELRASHEHPSLPKEGIVLLAPQPLQVSLGLAAFFCPLGFLLDAVQLDGLLALLYGLLVVALSYFLRGFVRDGVEGYHFREVVLVAIFLLQRGINIGQGSVVVSIVAGVERVPPTALRSILLRRTAYHQPCQDQQQERCQYRQTPLHLPYYNARPCVLL